MYDAVWGNFMLHTINKTFKHKHTVIVLFSFFLSQQKFPSSDSGCNSCILSDMNILRRFIYLDGRFYDSVKNAVFARCVL